MKKYRVKGLQSPDCAATVTTSIKTHAGLEEVNVNLATGEIIYGPAVCVDTRMLREAVENAGYKLEEEEA